MINVAILDDEAVYLDKEKEITEAYFREKQEDCRVDTFQSIEWFVSGLKETCYDLYILDVEMPGKNGLEVSREIRKLYPEPVIIFITNYVDYAIEAYEVNTFRYIPKSRLETKLTEAYDALFLILMEKNEKYYVIEKKGTLEKLAYSEIFYLRKEGKMWSLSIEAVKQGYVPVSLPWRNNWLRMGLSWQTEDILSISGTS